MQDFDDGASDSQDSGIAESVSGMSIRSYRPAATAAATSHYAMGGRPAAPHGRSGLGSVLGGGGAQQQQHPGPHARSEQRLVAAGADPTAVAHRLLEVAVRSAEVKYSKPLNTPIFTISVRAGEGGSGSAVDHLH